MKQCKLVQDVMDPQCDDNTQDMQEDKQEVETSLSVMDPQYVDNTQEMQKDKQEVETSLSVSQYIPSISCAGYIQRMQGIYSLHSNQVASPTPQLGACEQMWLAAQAGNLNQHPFAIVNNVDVQVKLTKGLSEVCRAIMHCNIDKLTIQELTYFCYFVDAIHRGFGILIPNNVIWIVDDYYAPRLMLLAQLLAHCFNMCAWMFGMFGWIDVTGEELRRFRSPDNRNLICHIQECVAEVYDNVMTYSKSLSKTDKVAFRQGYVQLFNAERRFLTIN